MRRRARALAHHRRAGAQVLRAATRGRRPLDAGGRDGGPTQCRSARRPALPQRHVHQAGARSAVGDRRGDRPLLPHRQLDERGARRAHRPRGRRGGERGERRRPGKRRGGPATRGRGPADRAAHELAVPARGRRARERHPRRATGQGSRHPFPGRRLAPRGPAPAQVDPGRRGLSDQGAFEPRHRRETAATRWPARPRGQRTPPRNARLDAAHHARREGRDPAGRPDPGRLGSIGLRKRFGGDRLERRPVRRGHGGERPGAGAPIRAGSESGLVGDV